MSGDRRRQDLGPPRGQRERRVTPSGRRASDALKMACPHCGASVSAVVRSRGGVVADKVGRRRECAECGRRFPTSERVDRELLERELEERGELRTSLVFEGLPAPTWDKAEELFHRLWGQGIDREYVKTDWMALQHVLAGLRKVS